MKPASTRPSLLRRIRDAHDDHAWREFDATYGDLIVAYARRRGLQDSDARDVRQLVMIGLAEWVRRFDYDPRKGRFRDYLRRVVDHAVRRHLSRTPRGWTPLEAASEGSCEADAPDLWHHEWTQYHCRRALRTLRKRREPASLAVFERVLAGASVTDAAREFAMSEAAVRKIKQRIRTELQEIVAQQVAAEDRIDG